MKIYHLRSFSCFCRWSLIAGQLEGRNRIQIRNQWNTNLKKNLARKKDIPTATQTTLSQKSLAAADLFDSTTYQAMEEPPVNNNYTDQFGPSITHVGYGNVPNGSSIPPLMVSAISMTNQVENEITLPAEEISNPLSNSTTCEAWPQFVMPGQNTSTISEAWPQSVGHNMPTDPQTLPSLPPQGLLSFTYQAMEEPTVNNYTDQFGPRITNITNSPVCGDLSLEYFSLVHPNTTLM